MTWIGITRSLALSGITDYSFVNDEAKWRGSEVHRMAELRLKGALNRKSVPQDLRGYLAAIDRFMEESGFIPISIEQKVQSKALGCRGRVDAFGLIKRQSAIVDFKTSSIDPAVALQLCLGGWMRKPGTWFSRIAVRLDRDGSYSMKSFRALDWVADLQTAMSAVRVARWKLQHGME